MKLVVLLFLKVIMSEKLKIYWQGSDDVEFIKLDGDKSILAIKLKERYVFI